MSAYTPEPAALDPRPLLPTPYTPHADDDDDSASPVVIKTGAWDAVLFDCFDSWVNCCTAYWLPCISLAQISQRIGWAPYWKVLQVLLAVYAVEILLMTIVAVSVNPSSSDDATTAQLKAAVEAHPALFVTGSIVSFGFSASSFLGSIGGLVLVLITVSLRGRVREMFEIPGSSVDDCVVSACCSPCTVAQMAAHVKSYKKGSCDIGPVDTLPGYGEQLPQYQAKTMGASAKNTK